MQSLVWSSRQPQERPWCIPLTQLQGPGTRVSGELRNDPTRATVNLALLSHLDKAGASDSEVWVEHHFGMDIFIPVT